MGSCSGEMVGGTGLGSYVVMEPGMVGVTSEATVPGLASDAVPIDLPPDRQAPMPMESEPTVVEELYPPVHIDPRAVPGVAQ